jgi:hypothetical protein
LSQFAIILYALLSKEVNFRRYLCADLVTLHSSAGNRVVNLEEIWESGAVIECEYEPVAGQFVQILAPGGRLAGTIRGIEAHEFGWRAEIAFSPLTPWRIETFRPQHLLGVPDAGQPDR